MTILFSLDNVSELNEFHDYFKLYLPTFLVIFIMFDHSLKLAHQCWSYGILSSIGSRQY